METKRDDALILVITSLLGKNWHKDRKKAAQRVCGDDGSLRWSAQKPASV